MKERQPINQPEEKNLIVVREINQSEYLAGLGEGREMWLNRLEQVVNNIRHIDRQRLAVDQAIFDRQILNYFCEETRDKNSELVSRRFYHTTRPKPSLGFNPNERNKTE